MESLQINYYLIRFLIILEFQKKKLNDKIDELNGFITIENINKIIFLTGLGDITRY